MPDSNNEQTALDGMDARAHFLRNIKQINNCAVLIKKHENGRLETVFTSQAFADMMECTPKEAMEMMNGLNFYKSTHPEDRPLVRSMLKNHVAYDGSTTLAIQKITAKKNSIWCNVHYSFINDFGENYVYCTYTDINALKEHEDRLRSTYSSLGNNFYHINDRTLALFRVNLSKDRFEEVKGKDLFDTDSIAYSYSESLVQRCAHFPIDTERELFKDLFDRENLINGYLAGKTNISQILYSIRRSGSSCFVNITAAITRHPLTGDVVAFITEQECNSEKVKSTLTDKILAQQFDMVCYLSNGQYGVTIGQTLEVKRGNIFPVTNSGSYSNYIEKQVCPVLYGTDPEKKAMAKALELDTIERELKVHEPYIVDIAIELEGEVFYKQFNFYSVDPQARFYILLKSDTTELQKAHLSMNEQLRAALDAANQANVAKTAFLSSMSHEIRTPMNAIIGLNRIALNDPDISDSTREYLEKIGSSAHHLLSLINDILDMSRIESGRMVVKNEEFPFPGMLEEINTMVGSQCQEKDISYECHVNGHINDYYIGDVMKLKQVLINILGNAVKFTPAKGSVIFQVEKTAENDQHSNFRFVIKDTGIGMDKDYLPKIFDAFSQENSTSTNPYGSTGLGLAITKNIVELMNGTISVESQKGKGSTFTVTISLRNSDRHDEGGNLTDPKELRVLVIDDDPYALEHARIVLDEAGIFAETCQSGVDAIEKIRLNSARRTAYNLILVDWKMPELDGIEVTKKIREVVGQKSAVIILTAYNWDAVEEEALNAGVDAFLTKPLFTASVLQAYGRLADRVKKEKKDSKKADLSGKRILIAEDIVINAEILKEILAMKGMVSDHAENGQEAVDMFCEHPSGYYDAILMDLRMPVMDGLKAAEAIRAFGREDSMSIPIVALTANAFDEDVQQTLRAGMNAHLSKPVEPDRVYETLAELIHS